MVSESIINNVKHFTASSPSKILDYIENKKDEINQEEKEIKESLPELEKIRNLSIKQNKAVVYTGFKGIQTATDEALNSLNSKDEILAMGVTEKKDQKYNDFWKRWSTKRIQKRILAKHIFSEKGEYFEIFKKMKFSEVKLLASITPVTIDIFGDNYVLILNYQDEPSCILINDKNTVISFKNFFKQLWKIAQK